MEDDGEDGTWQLVIHLQKEICSVTQVSHSQCVCAGVQVYAHLQPVHLGPQAALMQRLFELHLDARQEVPPQRTGNWLAHHHGASAEVHLPVTSHSLPQLIGPTQLKKTVSV